MSNFTSPHQGEIIGKTATQIMKTFYLTIRTVCAPTLAVNTRLHVKLAALFFHQVTEIQYSNFYYQM